MPSATMLAGDFGQVVVGLWGPGMRVDLNAFANFPAGIQALRVMMVADSACLHADAFCKSTSIT